MGATLPRRGYYCASQQTQRTTDYVREEKHSAQEATAPYPEFRSIEEELEYLRAENAYLKKLRALIQEKQRKKRE